MKESGQMAALVEYVQLVTPEEDPKRENLAFLHNQLQRINATMRTSLR
jgi:hypothetical protein